MSWYYPTFYYATTTNGCYTTALNWTMTADEVTAGLPASQPAKDDPIAWLRRRVQETIDQVEWPSVGLAA